MIRKTTKVKKAVKKLLIASIATGMIGTGLEFIYHSSFPYKEKKESCMATSLASTEIRGKGGYLAHYHPGSILLTSQGKTEKVMRKTIPLTKVGLERKIEICKTPTIPKLLGVKPTYEIKSEWYLK